MRWLRKHKLLTVTLGLLLALSVLLVGLLDPNRHLDFIAAQASELLGGEVSAAAINWGLADGLWLELEQLSISDATLIPVDIAAPRIFARAALRPLLDGQLIIEQIIIEQPTVTVHWRPASATATAPDQALDQTEQEASGLPLGISLVELTLRDGALTIIDSRSVAGRTLTQSFDRIDIDLAQLATGRALEVSLRARQANGSSAAQTTTPTAPGGADRESGTLQLTGQLQGLTEDFSLREPELDAALRVVELAVAPARGYLNNPALEAKLGGSISTQLRYRGDLSERAEVDAHLDLGAFQYHDTALWPRAVPGKPLAIGARVQQRGDALLLDNVRVEADTLYISASAALRSWRRNPILQQGQIGALVPLVELIPWVPWSRLGDSAAPLRELFNGAGVVELHQLQLPDLALKRPIDAKALLSSARAELSLRQLALPAGPKRPPIDDFHGRLSLAVGELTGSDLGAVVGALRLPEVNFTARDLSGAPRVDAEINGALSLADMPAAKKRQLLTRMGLRHIDLRGDIALQAHYDHARPRQWQAQGQLAIHDVELSTLSPETTLSGRGSLSLRRQQRLDMLIPSLSGRLNGAPFKLSGQLFSVGSPDFLADLAIAVKGLKLERLTPWLPALTPFRLAGSVTTDVDVYVLQADPSRTRVRGPLQLRNIQAYLPDQDIMIEGASGQLSLTAKRYTLDQLSMRLNQQTLNLSGSLQNPGQPRLRLKVHSPALDLDRLLPPPVESEAGAEQAVERASPAGEASARAELPRLAQQATVELDVDIDRGRFHQVTFNRLALDARYRQGTLHHSDLRLQLGSGNFSAQATANLLDLNAVPFTLTYQIDQMDLNRTTRLLSRDGQPLASGNLSSDASLRGNSRDIMQTLRGDLSLRAGPGKIPKRGTAADTLFNILSLINLQGIISGNLGASMAIDGMPYNVLHVDSRFLPTGMQLDPLELDTPAFATRVLGPVHLDRKDMDLNAVITVLGTLDTVLGFVPLIGQATADLTRVYLKISGPFDDPKVRVLPVEGLSTGIGTALSAPLGIFERADQRR